MLFWKRKNRLLLRGEKSSTAELEFKNLGIANNA
jgi:hypothetical protein